MSIKDIFNKGEALELDVLDSKEVNFTVEKQQLKVKSVWIEENDRGESFKIECVNDKGDIMYIFQPVKYKEDGTLKNPVYNTFEASNGSTIAQSPIHEIIDRAEELNAKNFAKKLETYKKNKKLKEFLEGLYFEIEVKSGEKKAGGNYNIVMTDKQKDYEEYKNAKYKEEQATTEPTETVEEESDLPF